MLHEYGTFLLYCMDAAHLCKPRIAKKNKATLVDENIEFTIVTVDSTHDAAAAVAARFENRASRRCRDPARGAARRDPVHRQLFAIYETQPSVR